MNNLVDNRYEILKILGQGGMGEVYQAKDLTTNEIIALKMLSLEASKSESVRRFKREFSMLTQLRHPNLCMVYDFGTTSERRHYFTMEYIAGVNLFVATRGLSYEQIYDLVVQVCRALAYINSKGLIHYDVKPGNILVKSGIAKLMDFGLAGERKASTGTLIKGTIQYMAPEVVKGITVDGRADLYSLGIVFYEVVAGGLPFKEDTSVALLREQLEKVPEFSEEIAQNLPAGLKEVIMKLMSKDPVDRYQNANEVIMAINQISKKNYSLETVETKTGYILSGKFVGRNEELKLLKNIFKNKETKFVLINGEMGSGKTRILREFRYYVQLNEGLFLSADCQQKESAYQPLKDLIKQLVLYAEGLDVSLIKNYGAELMKLMPQLATKEYMKDVPLAVPLDPKAERLRFFHNILLFIKTLKTKGRPFVLVLENLQWLDEASLDWLIYLLDNFEELGIFLCGTLRKEEVVEGHSLAVFLDKIMNKQFFSQLDLKNLVSEEVYTLITSMLGIGADIKNFSTQLYERTRGNPFFIEQTMHHLLEEEKISWESGVFKLSEEDLRGIVITTDLSEIIEKRFSRLDEKSLLVLRMAAVIGKKFNFPILLNFGQFNESELHYQLTELIKKGFIIEELEDHQSKFDFAQTGIREMLYNQIETGQRQKWHRELGRLLETIYTGHEDEIIEDLSFHFLKGEDNLKAFKYSLQAGDRARKIYATQKALNYYNLSLTIHSGNSEIGVPQEIINLYYNRGNSWETLGEYKKAVDDFNGMVEEAKKVEDKAKEAEGIEFLGVISWRRGDYEESLSYHRKAKELREEINNQEGIAKSLGYIGGVLWTMGRNKEALGYFENALAICEEIEEKNQIAAYLHNIGLVYSHQGDIEQAKNYLNRSLKVFKAEKMPRQIARNLHSLASVYYRPAGLFDKALAYYQESHKKFEEVGDRQGVAACLRDIGEVESIISNFDDALVSADKSLKIFQEMGEKRGIVTTWQALGGIYLGKEHYGKALFYYQNSLSLAQEIDEKVCVVINSNALGDIYRELGDIKKAEEIHLKSYNLAQEFGINSMENKILASLASDYLRLGDLKKAEEYLQKSFALTLQRQEKELAIYLHGYLSEISYEKGDHEEAEKQLNVFIESAEVIKARQLLARGYFLKAKWQEKGEAGQRRKNLKKATNLAEELNLLDLLAQIYSYWCEWYLAENLLRQAFENCKKCIQIFRTIVAQIEDETLKTTFLQDPRRQKVFHMLNEIKKITNSSK